MERLLRWIATNGEYFEEAQESIVAEVLFIR
jgi:hypothetical protein